MTTNESPNADTSGHTAVFVYGSLKRGHGLNGWLADCSTYDGLASLPGFSMYDLGAFPGIVPALAVEQRAGSEPVRGEVWMVPDWMLPALDRVEGVPTLYTRERVMVHRGESVGYVAAQTYVLAARLDADDKLIPSGWWSPRGGSDDDS